MWPLFDVSGARYRFGVFADGGEGVEAVSELEARWLVQEWGSSPFDRLQLRRVLYDVCPWEPLEHDDPRFVARMCELVESGRLRLYREARRAVDAGAMVASVEREEPPEPYEPEPLDVEHWIQFVVVDQDDLPLANVALEVTQPDGYVRRCRSDAQGVVYLRALDAGSCTLRLPEVDAASWAPA